MKIFSIAKFILIASIIATPGLAIANVSNGVTPPTSTNSTGTNTMSSGTMSTNTMNSGATTTKNANNTANQHMQNGANCAVGSPNCVCPSGTTTNCKISNAASTSNNAVDANTNY